MTRRIPNVTLSALAALVLLVAACETSDSVPVATGDVHDAGSTADVTVPEQDATAAAEDAADTPTPDTLVGNDANATDAGAGAESDGGTDAVAPVSPPDVNSRERRCGATFRYTGDDAEGVAVAGEWDDWNLTPMAREDDGAWAVTLPLEAGLYAYKLVIRPAGGGDDRWELDPQNPVRAYHGGVENSGARVADCAVPRVALETLETGDAVVTATVLMERATEGAGVAPDSWDVTLRWLSADDGWEERALTDDEWAVAGDALALRAEGLTVGKYWLEVAAEATDGAAAEPLSTPFWVEDVPFEWAGQVIYMGVTPRLANGDPSNDPEPSSDAVAGASAGTEWTGGDLAGVTELIRNGHFEDLGVGALWLTPYNRNPEDSYDADGGLYRVSGFHGYWPTRAREVDPRLGGAEALEELVAVAHDHGIRVLMDFVLNHVHTEHEYLRTHPEWFRADGCLCGAEGCDWTANRLECRFAPYLPDVDWTVREASEAFIDDAVWWMERFDLDGLRVDAVKHVEDLAVRNLRARLTERFEAAGTEVFLLGETAVGWGGDDIEASRSEYDLIGRYVGEFGLTGQFDFVLYHAVVNSVFAEGSRGLIHLDYWTLQSQESYPPGSVMSPYVGSHDTCRITSMAAGDACNKWENLPAEPRDDETYERVRLALTWLMAMPGAPILYYGDAYGEYGGADPDNRHQWRPADERSPRETALFDAVSAAARARRASPALRTGRYISLAGAETSLVFARVTDDDIVIVALNTASTSQTLTVAIPPDVRPLLGDAPLTDLLHPPTTTTAPTNNHLTLTLPPNTTAYFTP